MCNGCFSVRHSLVEDIRSAAIGIDCLQLAGIESKFIVRLTLSVNWHVNVLNSTIGAKDLSYVVFIHVLRELFHDNLGYVSYLRLRFGGLRLPSSSAAEGLHSEYSFYPAMAHLEVDS
jgi:hypothetical protein